MSAPTDPFAPRTTPTHSASSRVQTSIYMGIRSRYTTAGVVAWMMVRLAQPDHAGHAAAVLALAARPPAELSVLRVAVQKARASSKADDAWRTLCDAILVAIEGLDGAPDTDARALADYVAARAAK